MNRSVARAPSPAKSLPCPDSRPEAHTPKSPVHRSQTSAARVIRFAVGGRGRPPHVTHKDTMSTSPPLTKYKYRRRLPHLQKAEADLFVTFCTGGPLILPGEARSLVLEHCLREHGQRIVLHTVVVMPNHVHLLLSPLRDRDGWPFPLVDILLSLKSATAHRINKLLNWEGPMWQEESFDHVLRSDESLREKCEYIRRDPVRAGLVRRPEDYPWLWVNPESCLCGAGAPARERPTRASG